MKDKIHSYYLSKEQEAHDNLQKLQLKMRLLSWLRVGSFVFTLLFLGLAIYQGINAFFILALIGFISFLVCVRIHLRRQEDHRFGLALLNIYRDELLALEYSFDHYPKGEDHLNVNHPYADDLDLFGTGSVFQYLNRTTSPFGSDKLAGLLANTNIDIDQIRLRQEAVKELTDQRDWSENFNASGRLTESASDEKEAITTWLNTPYAAYSGVFYTTMLKSLPVFSIGLLVLAMMERIPWTIFFLFALIPLMVVGSKFKALRKEYQLLSQFNATLSKYYRLIKKIEERDWDSKLLRQKKSELEVGAISASDSVKELRGISEALDMADSMIGGLVLNALLLWNVRYVLKLKKWKEENRNKLPEWFDVIGEFEAFNSIGILAFNRDDLHYPTPTDKKETIIKTQAMGHLLIRPEERVNNNFDLELPGKFVILTGANMAGKSTFLRAIGSNMMLAASGAPVCAEKMSWRPLPLFSSMRTSDSLQSNESYFYAELKRLKNLLEYAESEPELFIILDEILKGTNSKDKAEGSALFVKKILSKNIYGIIATHDLSLCKLEDEFSSEVENLSFDVEIKDNDLHFDYKLHEGICQNMNATFLLNKMGLVD